MANHTLNLAVEAGSSLAPLPLTIRYVGDATNDPRACEQQGIGISFPSVHEVVSMTSTQLLLMSAIYLVFLAAVAYVTRARRRRLMRALAGGAPAAGIGLAAIVVGQALGLWHVALQTGILNGAMLLLAMVVSYAPAMLIIWRIDRRWGVRGSGSVHIRLCAARAAT